MDVEVGLRDLRQNASDLVRRVEAGESLTVTVSGRPAARLVPVAGRRWRSWAEVADVLSGPGAPGLGRERMDRSDPPADPFTRVRA